MSNPRDTSLETVVESTLIFSRLESPQSLDYFRCSAFTFNSEISEWRYDIRTKFGLFRDCRVYTPTRVTALSWFVFPRSSKYSESNPYPSSSPILTFSLHVRWLSLTTFHRSSTRCEVSLLQSRLCVPDPYVYTFLLSIDLSWLKTGRRRKVVTLNNGLVFQTQPLPSKEDAPDGPFWNP